MKKALLIFFLLIFCKAAVQAGNEPVLIRNKKSSYDLIGASQYIDKTGMLDISQVLKLDSNKFIPCQTNIPVFRRSKSAIWLKFSVVNLTDEQAYLKIDNPTIDTVQFFYYDPQKSEFIMECYGYNLPLSDRSIRSTSVMIKLPFCIGKKTDYYFRLASRKHIYIPITLGNSAPLLEDILLDYSLDSIYFGIVFVMIFFNLFLGLSLRSRTYYLYVLFLLFTGMFMFYFKGYTLFFNDPLKLLIGNYSNSIATIGVILSVFFTISFLKLREFSKSFYRFCLFLVALNTLIIFFEIIHMKTIAVSIQTQIVLLTSSSLIIIAVWTYYKGLKHARFYLLANGLYQISVILFVLPIMGIVSMPKFSSHILPLGHALDITILAIALADRINQLRRDKEKILSFSLQQEKILNEDLFKSKEELAKSEIELKNTNLQFQSLNQDLIYKNGQLIDNQIQLFKSLDEAQGLNSKLSHREEELTAVEEELRQSLNKLKSTYNELKITTENLESRERQVTAIIDSTNDMIILVDKNLRVTSANKGFKKVYKQLHNKDYVDNISITDVIVDKTLKDIYNSSYDKALGGDYHTCIIRHNTNGREWVTEEFYNPIINESGKVEGFAIFIKDITEKIQSETQKKEAEIQLQKSERTLRLAQKIAKMGSWSYNLSAGSIEFSEALYDLYEIPYDSKLTREFLAGLVGQEVIAAFKEKSYEAFHSSNPITLEFSIFLKDGREKKLYNIGMSSYNDLGQITEFYGSTQDITEIRTAENLLRKQTSELIESNKKTAEYKLMALRSVMNPHFLFNSLNSIQYFITKNDREQALIYLAMFSKLIRSILNSSISNYNTLPEELEILKLYVNLESLRFLNKFKTQFVVDPLLTSEEILIPSLLLQPYIENAIIHGLSYKDGRDGMLSISFSKAENKVLCIVEDNGVGRAKAMEIKKSNNLHKSVGMLLTKERIELINNDDQVSVVITDLYDKENFPFGTKVEVSVLYK